jgi:hypothetical protein
MKIQQNDENAKRTIANTNDSPRRLFVKTAKTIGIQQNATTPRRHDFYFYIFFSTDPPNLHLWWL